MLFDLENMEAQDRYKILTAAIVPRPIAWVTTLSKDGVVNAAPYSFFNMMGSDPATVALGVLASPSGPGKDTAVNIRETGEFCVNMVHHDLAEQMNITSIDAPSEVDELALAGLQATACDKIRASRIKEALVSLECRVFKIIDTAPRQCIVIGEVLCAHVDDQYVINPDKCYLDTPAMGLIGRMHGGSAYTYAQDLFDMTRPVWSEQLTNDLAEAEPKL